VNAEAVFFLCQGIGPSRSPGGAIVNISSSAAKLATTTEAAVYAASKAAVLSITRSFAYEFADIPITVNAICPGVIDTPMQGAFLEEVAALRGMTPDELSDARNAIVPLGRSASPDELAGLVEFLLSKPAAYMTGQAINYSGGLVTW
jgi:NAD(P)-dependent dehydrogenase (short-subunit alcohol dehydrogenase family)